MDNNCFFAIVICEGLNSPLTSLSNTNLWTWLWMWSMVAINLTSRNSYHTDPHTQSLHDHKYIELWYEGTWMWSLPDVIRIIFMCSTPLPFYSLWIVSLNNISIYMWNCDASYGVDANKEASKKIIITLTSIYFCMRKNLFPLLQWNEIIGIELKVCVNAEHTLFHCV